MSIVDILPLVVIVLFWLLLFGFTLWFARAALHAPIEGELDGQHGEAGHAH